MSVYDDDTSRTASLIEDGSAARFSAHSSVMGDDEGWPAAAADSPRSSTPESPQLETSCCHQNYIVRVISCFMLGAMIMQVNALNEYCVDRYCVDDYGQQCSDLSKDDKDSADSKGAMFSTICVSLPNVFSILTTVYLAVISDYTGRQRVLIFNCGLSLLSSTAVMICVYFRTPLWVLLPAQAISGMGGSVGTLLALCFAHTVDVTPRQHRTAAFSILESTIFLSGAIGSTMGGQFSKFSASAPFIAVASCTAVGNLLVWVAFKDQRDIVPQQLPSWCTTMKASIKLATAKTVDQSRTCVKTSPRFLAFLFAIIYVCIIGVFSLLVSYLKCDKFGLPNHQIGFIISGQYLCKWASLWLLPPLLRCCCVKLNNEVLLIRLGGVVAAVSVAGYAIAPQAIVVVAIAMVEAMDVVAVPALRSLFSLAVGDDEQGTALSVVANIETIVQLVVPLGFGQLYGRTTHWMPFVVISCIAVVFCGLTIKLQPIDGGERTSTRRSSMLFGGSFVNAVPPVVGHKDKHVDVDVVNPVDVNYVHVVN